MAVTTYHCLCTELVLATTITVQDLPKRQSDASIICKITAAESLSHGASVFTGAVNTDDQAVVLKLEDGFEKRYPLQCSRCRLDLGYHLDNSQLQPQTGVNGAATEVYYLRADGLQSTSNMLEKSTTDS